MAKTFGSHWLFGFISSWKKKRVITKQRLYLQCRTPSLEHVMFLPLLQILGPWWLKGGSKPPLRPKIDGDQCFRRRMTPAVRTSDLAGVAAADVQAMTSECIDDHRRRALDATV